MNLTDIKLPTRKNPLIDFLVKFTPKNHNNVKHLEMGDSSYLVEASLENKVDNQALSSIINRILDKLPIETNSSYEIEVVDGFSFPVMYLEDGVIVICYPIYLRNL